MSKDPCRPHTGKTQWSMWVCLLTWDCLLHYNFHNMAYKKMFNLVKWGVELKMNWLNWSIPISSGFQFQFNSNSKSFNSIPIQFMLNWIELIINSNSIHELIRALHLTSIGIPMLKVRRSRDLLIFNMETTIPGKDGLYVETAPWLCFPILPWRLAMSLIHARYIGITPIGCNPQVSQLCYILQPSLDWSGNEDLYWSSAP